MRINAMGVTAMSGRPRAHQISAWACAIAAAAGLVAVAGCGSSPPAYCSDRTSLQNSVKGLTNLNPSGGVSGLKSQVAKIKSDANKLVSSAKGDFPSQTSAIKSSVDALQSTITALPPSPSATQIATVAADAKNVVDSVNSFETATKSKCS